MKKYVKRYRKQFIMGPAFKLTEAILELLVPVVMAKIVDVGIATGDTAYILKMGGLMLLLGALGLVFAVICQYSAAVAQQGVGTDLRNDMFRQINRMSQGDIDKFGTASLTTRITNDVNQIQLAVAMLIRLMFRSPFLIIGALVMAMLIDLKMSIIFFIAGALVAGILYGVMSRSLPFYKIIQKGLDKVSRITGENLDGARVIRAFGGQAHEKKRFAEASADLTRISIRVGKLSALLNPLTFAVMNLAVIAILYFGGKNVDAGTLARGEVIAFTSYMTQILLSLIVFANVIVIFTKAEACYRRVKEVLEFTPALTDKGNTELAPDENAPAVTFDHVDFSFTASEEKALSDISFSINKGETLGIIGGTGSGKTALVNLITRLYDVQSGCVSVLGHDVRQYPFGQLRGITHTVLQKNQLFSATIRENLQLGDRAATDEQLWEALKTAQAAEFVEKLPQGLDTVVEEGGKNFSGGQKQRLCIARALLGKPQILILDDASSALDFATDAALRRAIREHLKDTTVLLVSQRYTSLKNADKILVLDDGVSVGFDTHENLLEDCPVYREICLSQSAEKELKA